MNPQKRGNPASGAEDWPRVPAADHPSETARLLALNLREELDGNSVRSVARDSDVDEGTIRRVLAGAVWPDLRTISSLEHALQVSLYPRRD